ncbi:MAG: hypothetical protein NTY41_14020 [Proteobacteria bacterium]|nr:hypothetical protein [Pseudomonadota bacterium]
MKFRASMLAIIAAGSLATTPSWAQHRGGHGGGGDHFWGPFGFLLGTAILYSAVQQPRTVYYAPPPVVYAPPVYAPVAVQPYYVEPTYVSPPMVALPPPAPPYAAQSQPTETPGGQWWYLCKKPAGYYPYVRECPSGWEKVSPTPPGVVKP